MQDVDMFFATSKCSFQSFFPHNFSYCTAIFQKEIPLTYRQDVFLTFYSRLYSIAGLKKVPSSCLGQVDFPSGQNNIISFSLPEFNFFFWVPVIGFKIMRTRESNSFCHLDPLVQNAVCHANRKCILFWSQQHTWT